jgi:hypothetical protein
VFFGKFRQARSYALKLSRAATAAAIRATEQTLVANLAQLTFDWAKDCELPTSELFRVLQLISNTVK